MTKTKPNSQGRKTMEQRKRMLERKPDMPRKDAEGHIVGDAHETAGPPLKNRAARRSEFPVSRGGMHQESRQHNKPSTKQR